MLSVPKARTETGKKAFLYSSPSSWNTLQKDLKLIELISLNALKSKIKDLEADALICKYSGTLYQCVLYCCLSWPGHPCKRGSQSQWDSPG